MAYIYKITNQINQKVYIGKTSRSVEERWKEHRKTKNQTLFEARPLYSAMRKYGIKNFSIETIEECSEEESNNRECYWIEYYQSNKYGYNATSGGDGRKLLDYDLVRKVYKETKNETETARILGCSKSAVGVIIRSYNEVAPFGAYLQKPVAKLDAKTEEIIAVYESISEAEKENGNTRHISECCKGKRKTCKGFKWKYL